MQKQGLKRSRRIRRHRRIRAKVVGTAHVPRLSVFRSNRHIFAQLIDDEKGVTLAAAHSKNSKAKTPSARSREVGATLAQQAKEKNIQAAVFDRGGYIYTGNIRQLAEGAREGGLKF